MADYSFTPQFANLSGLAPLPMIDVTRGGGLQFQPLRQIEVPSDRSELVGQSIAGAAANIAQGALSGITAKWEKEEELAKEQRKYAHELHIADIRSKALDPYIESLKTRKLEAETEAARQRLNNSLPSGYERRMPSPSSAKEEPLTEGEPKKIDFTLRPSELETGDGLSSLSVPDDMASRVAEQAKSIENIPLAYKTAGIGSAVTPPAPSEETPLTLSKFSASLISPEKKQQIISEFEKYGIEPKVIDRQQKTLLSIDTAEPKKEVKTQKIKAPRSRDFDTEAEAQAEAYRDIPGFKPGTYEAKVDEKGVYYRVPPRIKMSPSEISAERKSIADAQKAEMELTSKSKKEGKTPLDSQINKIIALKSASEDLNSIAKRLNNIPEQFRGPVTGFFAKKNPYSADIQALNSQIIQIIPGLARGVFGEVGVLTEKDAERYLKTIPNNQQDPKVSSEVLKELTEKLERSKKNTVSAYRKAGYDMSEFEYGYFEDETQKPKSDEIGDLSMQLEQFPVDQRNSPEFLALRKKLYNLVREQELQKKGTSKPTPQATPPAAPKFPIPTPKATQSTETLESFLGPK